MSRRSTRTQLKRQLSPSGIKVEQVELTTGSPTKKRKTVKGVAKNGQTARERPRRLRGLLQAMIQAPLDILFEVFSYLDPLAILRLSRTSKELRALLMRKSSEFVWRAARENIENLPELPPDLNEPQYASLIFDSFCHLCLTPRITNIMWKFRTRRCKKCLYVDFARITDPMIRKYTTELPARYISVAPRYRPSHAKKIPLFSVALVRRDRIEYRAVKGQEGQPKTWLSSKRQQYEAVEEHVERCMIWLDERAEERKNELTMSRIRRRDDIVERLKDLGWGEVILKMPFQLLMDHKLVDQPKDMTDAIWSEIEEELIEFMEEVQPKL